MNTKFLRLFVIAVIIFLLYDSSAAEENLWLGTAGDNEWGNASNWENDHVPDTTLWPTEEAHISSTNINGGPVLGTGDMGTAYRIVLGWNDGESMYGELSVDGGVLTTIDHMSTAVHEGASALITINSGFVHIGDPQGSNGHLYLGLDGSAILNMNGGSFTVNDNLQLGGNASGYGEINLAGGTLQAGTLELGQGSGLINITDGTLILKGDNTDIIDSFIASGLIVGYAGSGSVNVDYEDGITIVTAIDDSLSAFTNVDSFESYTALEGNRIYEFWTDGFTNNSGSFVGNADVPLAERNFVHAGKQSLSILYNNFTPPYYSEVIRTWETPQDWAIDNVEVLVLYVKGALTNLPDRLYIAVQDNHGLMKVINHPDGEAILASGSWEEWRIPLGEFVDAGLDITQVKTMYIGIGDRDNPSVGGVGNLYVDDIALINSLFSPGYALEFDGIDDYVETPLSDVPKDGTVEAWIKTTSQEREAVISSHGGYQEFRLHLNYQPGVAGSSPGVLGLNVRFFTLTAFTDIGSEIYDGSWHHVAFVWEGRSPGIIRAYWDGHEKAVTYRHRKTWQGNYQRTVVHVIGREDLDNNNYFFKGMIDEVRFWSETARTQFEIKEYMNKELTGQEDGLTGYWKFNDPQGAIAYDSSPNGNDGIISGAVWISDTPPIVP